MFRGPETLPRKEVCCDNRWSAAFLIVHAYVTGSTVTSTAAVIGQEANQDYHRYDTTGRGGDSVRSLFFMMVPRGGRRYRPGRQPFFSFGTARIILILYGVGDSETWRS